jgi:hypothetical protein
MMLSDGEKRGSRSFSHAKMVVLLAQRQNTWLVDEAIRGRHYCHGCDGECVGQGICCSDWLKRGNKEKER